MQAVWRKIWGHKIWLLSILLVIVAAKYGYSYYITQTTPVSVIKTVAVARGDIASVVSATGTIIPVNLVNVSSKITGLIKEVAVNENEEVKTGQLLMVLDATHLEALVSQAQAKLANASANYQRNQQLAAIGAISSQQLDAARMDYSVAQAAYDDAGSQLDDTIIRAPINGTVIGKPIPAGQTVSPGISTPMILATVADMSKMQIEAQVDESDIGKVLVGQQVTFTVDAYPDKTFTGKVSIISQRATISQNVVYYTVTIDVGGAEGLLKPTMTARVSINVGESKNTLLVPLTAVKENKGQRYVQVMRNGTIQNAPVTIGLSNDDQVEIKQGVNEGDQVSTPQGKAQGSSGGTGPNPMRSIMR